MSPAGKKVVSARLRGELGWSCGEGNPVGRVLSLFSVLTPTRVRREIRLVLTRRSGPSKQLFTLGGGPPKHVQGGHGVPTLSTQIFEFLRSTDIRGSRVQLCNHSSSVEPVRVSTTLAKGEFRRSLAPTGSRRPGGGGVHAVFRATRPPGPVAQRDLQRKSRRSRLESKTAADCVLPLTRVVLKPPQLRRKLVRLQRERYSLCTERRRFHQLVQSLPALPLARTTRHPSHKKLDPRRKAAYLLQTASDLGADVPSAPKSVRVECVGGRSKWRVVLRGAMRQEGKEGRSLKATTHFETKNERHAASGSRLWARRVAEFLQAKRFGKAVAGELAGGWAEGRVGRACCCGRLTAREGVGGWSGDQGALGGAVQACCRLCCALDDTEAIADEERGLRRNPSICRRGL